MTTLTNDSVISLPVRDDTEQTVAWQDVDFQWLDDRQFNRDRRLTVDTDQNVTVDTDRTYVKQIDDGLVFGDNQRVDYNPFVFAPVLVGPTTEVGGRVAVDTVRVRRQDFVAGGVTSGTSFSAGWLGTDNYNNNASSSTNSDSDSDSDSDTDMSDSALHPGFFHGRADEDALTWFKAAQSWLVFKALKDKTTEVPAISLLLRDNARAWFQTLPTIDLTLDRFERYFMDRYVSQKENKWQDMVALYDVMQKSGQSVADFITAVQIKANHVGADDIVTQAAVLRGLKPHIRAAVLQHDDLSLDAIRRWGTLAEKDAPAKTDAASAAALVDAVNALKTQGEVVLQLQQQLQNVQLNAVQYEGRPDSSLAARPAQSWNQSSSPPLSTGTSSPPQPRTSWSETRGSQQNNYTDRRPAGQWNSTYSNNNYVRNDRPVQHSNNKVRTDNLDLLILISRQHRLGDRVVHNSSGRVLSIIEDHQGQIRTNRTTQSQYGSAGRGQWGQQSFNQSNRPGRPFGGNFSGNGNGRGRWTPRGPGQRY